MAKRRVLVPIQTERGKDCILAENPICMNYCPFWAECEADNSPWRCDYEDVPGNDTNE